MNAHLLLCKAQTRNQPSRRPRIPHADTQDPKPESEENAAVKAALANILSKAR